MVKRIQALAVLLLGLLSIWPIAYVSYFLVSLVMAVSRGNLTLTAPYLFVLHLVTIALVFGLLVFYVWHAFHNKEIETARRYLWIIAFLIGHFVVFFFYWYWHVWKRRGAQESG